MHPGKQEENRMNQNKEPAKESTYGASGPWLAAYLYCGEPWENFLVKSVQPFVRTILEEKLADQYFFIRYWERGPHIRLRFTGDETVLEKEVKPRLDEYFRGYFREYPTERQMPEYVKNWPEEHRWYPNDTIQYIQYEPEVTRYGGLQGIRIGEKQFEASSNAVIAVIEDAEEWEYDRALGAAIQLHLGFAYALGMDLIETREFFSRIAMMWFSRAFGYDEKMTPEQVKERKEKTWQAFSENFSKQKEVLVPYHETLWEAFTGGYEFDREWLTRWIGDMRTVGQRLEQAQSEGKLEFSRWQRPQVNADIPESRQMLWTILESYVHMTNNRLGILNRDEAYLGYLIKQSLISINK
jgi:hypothetical protein